MNAPVEPPQPAEGELSIQQRFFPDLPCFGCGPGNERGLQLRSYPRQDVVVAGFTPWPEHNNGLGYLNGGIIATVLDCHSAAAVVHEAAGRGWPTLPGVPLPYVTAGLDLRYLRPSPLTQTVTLVADLGRQDPGGGHLAVQALATTVTLGPADATVRAADWTHGAGAGRG
jgi:acyl-coenzyme A thioesterase PaaI-like protein